MLSINQVCRNKRNLLLLLVVCSSQQFLHCSTNIIAFAFVSQRTRRRTRIQSTRTGNIAFSWYQNSCAGPKALLFLSSSSTRATIHQCLQANSDESPEGGRDYNPDVLHQQLQQQQEKDQPTTSTTTLSSSPEYYHYAPNRDDQQDRNSIASNPTTLSSSSSSSVNEYTFFDEAYIHVRAGSGGQGSSTYIRIVSARGQFGPPDGGNGGRGGSIMLQVDRSLNTLAGLTTPLSPQQQRHSPNSSVRRERGSSTPHATVTTGTTIKRLSSTSLVTRHFRAENGEDGDRQYQNGRVGQDYIIRVPPGTMVQEQQIILHDNGTTSEYFIDLGTVNNDDGGGGSKTLIVARGGEGGEGTAVLGPQDRSGGRRVGKRRPRRSALGGESRTLKLTLRILADVAIVGVPNAGKSTFLAQATRAKPKIANYPFTTVIPNLGVWMAESTVQMRDAIRAPLDITVADEDLVPRSLVLCDVPGLIAGAAYGAGLGHAFLRHVERCDVILHLVDATSSDPIADYQMLNEELVRYGTGQLAIKPQVVVINKLDAYNGASEEWEEGLTPRWSRSVLQEQIRQVVPHSRIMWISAKEGEGVNELMQRLATFVGKVKGSAVLT